MNCCTTQRYEYNQVRRNWKLKLWGDNIVEKLGGEDCGVDPHSLIVSLQWKLVYDIFNISLMRCFMKVVYFENWIIKVIPINCSQIIKQS